MCNGLEDRREGGGRGGVYWSEVAVRLLCRSRWHQKKGGGCVCVSGRGVTDVWKKKTHNIRGGGGGECVRSRSGTDVCKEKTHNIVGGVYVYSQCGQSKGTVP